MRVQKRCQYSLGGTGMRQHCRFIIAALFGYYYYYGTAAAACAATGSAVGSQALPSQKQGKRGISTTNSGTEGCAASGVEAQLLPVLRLTHTQSWYPSIAAAGVAQE